MTLALTADNGRLDAELLEVADTGPNGPQRLRADVAALWRAMLAAGMPPGRLRSGYRTRAQQEAEVARARAGLTPSAARVGGSFHGEGVAADADEPARSWLRANGAAYGVVLDTVPREPWHVLIDPARADRTPPAPTRVLEPAPTQEDDMKDAIIALYVLALGRMPDATGLADALVDIATGKRTFLDVEAAVYGSDEFKSLDPEERVRRRLALPIW